ncbi:MAG: hypothetical protein K2G45_02035 [Lachnospiraceae bacterium]|nr:hypothetical protein [Lachnospiraceae bacterium]
MKDNMDMLLKKALEADMEPSKELNNKVLESIRQKSEKTTKVKKVMRVPRVAAVMLAICCVAPLGVYAANKVMKKVFVTDHAISVGNPDYVDDAAIASTDENVEIENVSHEEGDGTVKWLTKDVETVNGYATNTYYAYKDYDTAVKDAGLDTWFNKAYENDGNVTYVVTETQDTVNKCINACFKYGEGSFFIAEEIMTGNVADDLTSSVQLQNTKNKRDYTATSGQVFTLVDQITNDGTEDITTTFVMVAYDDYYGYISFDNLKDEEIHNILDTIAPH